MSNVQAIKDRLLAKVSLEQVVGESVTLSRRSGRPTGCCPFHGEKTPSFFVYHDHYHCFGCGAHGDIISFVQKKQGIGFKDALRWLCERYGVEAPELKNPDLSNLRKASTQARILTHAQNYFVAGMQSPEGKVARDYCLARGFSEEAQKRFGFGYAPNEARALFSYLKKHGFHAEDIEEASLISIYQDRPIDFFRHRLMIPIRDNFGRILAFGGRALGDQGQKYKNSRFDKAATLFALDRARKAMGMKSRAIVVEGYLDTLSLHQAGFEETVACQGTALSALHIRALKAATPLVYLLFDGDAAGHHAALKVLKEALNVPTLRFKVGELPTGEDPDSFIKRFGAEALEGVLSAAPDLLSYCIDAAIRTHDQAALPAMIRSEFIPWLVQIEDPIQVSFLVEKIAQKTGVLAKDLRTEIAKMRHEPQAQVAMTPEKAAVEPAKPQEVSPLPPLAFELIGHMYYASDDELELGECLDFLQHELQVDSFWLDFAKFSRKNRDRESEGIWAQGDWVLGNEALAFKIIEQLEGKAPAFAKCHRKKAFERLRLIHREQSLQSTMTELKQDLRTAAANGLKHTEDLLLKIAALNAEQARIVSQIRGL